MSGEAGEVRGIHMLGICGTAMAALAGSLHRMGYRVTGSDEHVYPPMSGQLAGLGIAFAEGYRAENLPPDTDLVVVGNVIREANPEAAEMRRRNLAHLSMAEAVQRFLIAGRETVAVVGTHGKTTTTALAAHTLAALGEDPGVLVGGVARNFDGNFRLGEGAVFVIEGDEYDTAYFDKTPKFFKYRPHQLIFTSLEFDHADIYADLETIRGHFERLLAGLPAAGALVACGDDPLVRELAPLAPCRVVTYGQEAGNDCRLEGWRATGAEAGAEFHTHWEGRRESWRIPLAGIYNGLNATAVIVLAQLRGHEPARIRQGLAGFAGVKRRQEVRGEVDGITVIDDFAHHPTAVRLTIEAMKAQYPGRRLWAVFEPRSFTARGSCFQQAFPPAFLGAERVVLAAPFRPAQPGTEPALDTEAIAAFLRARGVAAVAAADTGAVLEVLLDGAERGDVVLIMSNGGFDDIHEKLLAGLGARGTAPARAQGGAS